LTHCICCSHKALDFWLTYIRCNDTVLAKHYTNSSFLRLSASSKTLILDMSTALQPLAQMPFRLEYNFEYRQLEQRQGERLSAYLLNKHVARSADGSHALLAWILHTRPRSADASLCQVSKQMEDGEQLTVSGTQKSRSLPAGRRLLPADRQPRQYRCG